MKTNNLKWISAVLFTALVIVACKKYPSGVGPEYYSAKSDFAVINNSFFFDSLGTKRKKADFTLTVNPNGHSFVAEFNSRVDWTVKITGLRSGAFKVFKGSSTSLDVNNSTWKGGHSGLFFFKKNETCVAELSFLGSTMVLKDTFLIKNTYNFNNKNAGVILITKTDFESYYNTLKRARADVNVDPASFPSQFAFLEGGDFDKITPRKRSYPNGIQSVDTLPGIGSVEGSCFMRLAYTPNSLRKAQCDNTGYFAAALQHRYFGVGGQNFVVTDWTDPNDVWLNIYAYGDEYTMKSFVNVQLHEADLANAKNPLKPNTYDFGGDTLSPIYCKARVTEGYSSTNANFLKPGSTNNIDKYDPNIDDSWDFQFKPDTKGWKLYSIKLADMASGFGNNGLRIREPNRIARVQIALIADKPFQYSALAFDYVTLTKGGPFNPDKY